MSDTGVTSNSLAAALAAIIEGTLNASDNSGAMRLTASIAWSAQITWTEVRVYAYPTGGTVATYVGSAPVSPARAGTIAQTLPNQCALVLTLQSDQAGRRHRGRMYLPIAAASLDAAANMDSADVTALVTAWRTAFSDINTSDTGQIVVVSSAAAAYVPLASVKMDSRIDIQRRRANSQAISFVNQQPVTPHGS